MLNIGEVIMSAELVAQIINTGISGVLLYLLLREQQRSEQLQQKIFQLLEKLSEDAKNVTQELRRVNPDKK